MTKCTFTDFQAAVSLDMFVDGQGCDSELFQISEASQQSSQLVQSTLLRLCLWWQLFGLKFAAGTLVVTKCALKDFGQKVLSHISVAFWGAILTFFKLLRPLKSRVKWRKALSSIFVCDGGPSGSSLNLEP